MSARVGALLPSYAFRIEAFASVICRKIASEID